MLKYRLFSFFLLLSLLGTLFYLDFVPEDTLWGRIFFTLLAATATIPISAELTTIINKAGIPSFSFWISGLLCSCLLLLSAFLPREAAILEGIFYAGSIFVLLMWIAILTSMQNNERCRDVAGSAMVFLFVSVMVFAIWIIHEAGPKWFLFFVLATKACDTGGYIAGMTSNKLMKNGNHKIAPSISPKKSWEGLAGGIVLSLAAGIGFGWNNILGIGSWETVLISFLLCLGSFAGDLSESALKRIANIKDSGNWIPGMGGILDVLDSFIYNAPALAFFLTILK